MINRELIYKAESSYPTLAPPRWPAHLLCVLHLCALVGGITVHTHSILQI